MPLLKRREKGQSMIPAPQPDISPAISQYPSQGFYYAQSSTNLTIVPDIQPPQLYIPADPATTAHHRSALTSKINLHEQKQHAQHLVRKSCNNLREAVQGTVNVTHHAVEEVQEIRSSVGRGVEHLRGAIEKKFDDILTAIDESRFSGREEDLGKFLNLCIIIIIII